VEQTLLSAAFDSDFLDPLPDSLKPLPGELRIPANFPEATVEITQSEDVNKAAEGVWSGHSCPLPLTLISGCRAGPLLAPFTRGRKSRVLRLLGRRVRAAVTSPGSGKYGFRREFNP
jgi:hypothetical protein